MAQIIEGQIKKTNEKVERKFASNYKLITDNDDLRKYQSILIIFLIEGIQGKQWLFVLIKQRQSECMIKSIFIGINF